MRSSRITLPLLASLTAALSAAAQSSATPDRGAGAVVERSVRSAEYGRSRRYWVYTPAGYPAASERYPLLLAFDGGAWIGMHRPAMLDSLAAAGATPRMVAVMVDDSTYGARLDDLANRAKFVRFVVDELLPAVRREFRVTADPHRTMITGESAGGLAAAFVALRHPEIFGSVFAQSGAFWRGPEASNDAPYEWLAAQYAAAPKADIRFVIDVGAAETIRVLGGSGPVFLDATRRFRDTLRAKGYEVLYTEIPNGQHSPQTWGPRTPVGIAAIARQR